MAKGLRPAAAGVARDEPLASSGSCTPLTGGHDTASDLDGSNECRAGHRRVRRSDPSMAGRVVRSLSESRAVHFVEELPAVLLADSLSGGVGWPAAILHPPEGLGGGEVANGRVL